MNEAVVNYAVWYNSGGIDWTVDLGVDAVDVSIGGPTDTTARYVYFYQIYANEQPTSPNINTVDSFATFSGNRYSSVGYLDGTVFTYALQQVQPGGTISGFPTAVAVGDTASVGFTTYMGAGTPNNPTSAVGGSFDFTTSGTGFSPLEPGGTESGTSSVFFQTSLFGPAVSPGSFGFSSNTVSSPQSANAPHATPEPGSLALCGLAFAAVGCGHFWRRRKKNATSQA
jgi:hypothetical protein